MNQQAPSADPLRTLSIIIPAWNERERIGTTLDAVAAYARRSGRVREIIVVDDGSSDGTADVVRSEDCSPIELQILVNDRNYGKGHSVRRGMLAASGELLLMCDADESTPIEELDGLLPLIERGFDIVIGSRDLPESRLDPPQPLARRIAAWVFRALRRRMLLREIRDTQCGFKLFTREAGRDVFDRQVEPGWLFDCEVLSLADRLGYRIAEVGVVWRDRSGSRVRPLREALHAIPTLRRIRRRVRRSHPAARTADCDVPS